jgi:hypothetical protein
MICRAMLPLLALTGCAEAVACTPSVLAVKPSPGDEHRAVIFTRPCGTDAVTVNVSIAPQSTDVGATAGNVFVTTLDLRDRTVALPRIEWAGRSRLRIYYDSAARIERREPEVATVNVEYLPLPAETP